MADGIHAGPTIPSPASSGSPPGGWSLLRRVRMVWHRLTGIRELQRLAERLGAVEMQLTQRFQELQSRADYLAATMDAHLSPLPETLRQADQRHHSLAENLRQTDQRHQSLVESLRQADQRHQSLAESLGQADQRHQTLTENFQRLDQTFQHQEARLQDTGQRGYILESRVTHLVDQLDLLKSSLEVSREQVKAFHQWKRSDTVAQRPLVSVCVATYNRAQLLTERCLPSILRQTYPHFEVIVVGDHCTDHTQEAVNALGDPRIRFVNLPQRGPYPDDPLRRWMVAGTAAMNHALSLCQGDYVTHLDDDDEYLPDRLEKLTLFAASNQADFLWHPFDYQLDDGNWTGIECRELRLGSVTTSAIFYRSWLKQVLWNVDAHLLMEPGDWNRIRRIKYLNSVCLRYPEALTRHYRERNQAKAA